jgi:DNA-binding transcriptional ArsR family regulator
MTDQSSPPGDGAQALRFACACTSAAPVAEDPWVAIPNQRKLSDGTKELILNVLARQPRTVAQLAQQLDLSPPAVHRHVVELSTSELIREVEAPPNGRRPGVARYYQPNFPIVRATDREVLQPVLDELADGIAALFRSRQPALERAYDQTNLPAQGESFADLLHYLYATATRTARERLEEDGTLPPWPEHADGSRWVWWADEP